VSKRFAVLRRAPSVIPADAGIQGGCEQTLHGVTPRPPSFLRTQESRGAVSKRFAVLRRAPSVIPADAGIQGGCEQTLHGVTPLIPSVIPADAGIQGGADEGESCGL